MDLKLKERLVDEMSQIPWRKLSILTLCLGLPLAGLISLVVAFNVICTTIENSAEYNGVTFFGYDDKFSGAVVPYYYSSNTLADCQLFVKFHDHDAISIHEITEAYLQSNFPFESPPDTGTWKYNSGGRKFTRRIKEETVEYWGFGMIIEFKAGKLEKISLSSSDGMTCSNRLGGEYIELPIRCKDLYRAWGRPDTVGRQRKNRGFGGGR